MKEKNNNGSFAKMTVHYNLAQKMGTVIKSCEKRKTKHICAPLKVYYTYIKALTK